MFSLYFHGKVLKPKMGMATGLGKALPCRPALDDVEGSMQWCREFSGRVSRWSGSLAAVILSAALSLAAVSGAAAGPTGLQPGDTIVTGFSGTAPPATPPASGDPIDGLFIDLNGASARVWNLPTAGQPAQGQLLTPTLVMPIKAGDVGQVFGIALDDGRGPDGQLSGTPDIYLTATSTFGLQIVVPDASGQFKRVKTGQPGAQWMAGQWGDAGKGGSPGSIWKVNGATGEVSKFADIALNGQANSGPGLGNIAFDAKSRQIFVSDLETGMIHRLDMHGTDLGYYDHGSQGRVSQGLPPVAYDPSQRLDITKPAFHAEDAASWHYAQRGRMVWGLKVSNDRLYYATAEGPQVWSISIGADGSFGTDSRMEIDVTGTPNNNAIPDVTFDGPDTIYLAQRGTARGDYTYRSFAEGKKSVVVRYLRDPKTGKWQPAAQEYAVGFPPDYRNTNGGVAIDSCGKLVWTTGELLRQGSGLSGPEIVHGLQGMDKSLVRPANQPPTQSYFADFDSKYDDPDASGHIGDVEIWQQPCQSFGQYTPFYPPGYTPPPPPPTGTFNLTLTKIAVPYYCAPNLPCFPPAPGSAPADCVPGGQGWLCSYKIVIKNTGSLPYAGPLTVNDWLPAAPAGAIMTFTPQPPWFCAPTGIDAYRCQNPFVLLNPGDSTELNVVVDLPKSYTLCYLDNAAALEWPFGYHDANPLDDASFATAHIPGSYCPPPTGDHTNLTIHKYPYTKYCFADGADWNCLYLVVVTNTGPGVYSGKIVVDEVLPAGTTGLFSAPWVCVGGPAYSCTHPPVNLNPAQSIGLWVLVHVPGGYAQPGHCDVPNKAHISFAPGGSLQNTNAGDDDASASATIPSTRCLSERTNLKIEKTGRPCVPVPFGQFSGWNCPYVVTVTNTGPGLYSGNIAVGDTFSLVPGAAAFAPQPPWNCVGAGAAYQCTYPGALLAPGQTVVLQIHALLQSDHLTPGQCSLTNTAQILAAPGGSPLNTNPADDTASATDTLANPGCVQPLIANPPQPARDGHVMIEKTCKPSAAGGAISCRITLTNDGGVPIATPVTFGDQGNWKGGGALQVSSAKPDDAAIQCSGLPGALTCTMPGRALAPGVTHYVDVTIAGGGRGGYHNCAFIVAPGSKPSCVDGGNNDISVTKTAPASCQSGKDCTFQVTITNISDSPFSGPLMVGDLMSLGGAPANGASITSITPALGCAAPQGTMPFSCVAPTSLAGHETHMHSITVHMPASDSAAPVNGINCFMAVDPASGSNGTGSGPLAATAAGNGAGYSCVAFSVTPKSCPGDLQRIGTKCKCPPGTNAAANYHCTSETVPLVTPLPPVCTDRSRRMTSGECCPRGQIAYGNSCRTPETPKYCPQGQLGTYPDCTCPRGTLMNDAGLCIKTPPPPPVQKCQLPQLGTYPNCYCPRGTAAVEGDCVPLVQKCDPPQLGNKPNCRCPSDRPNLVNGQCVPNQRYCPQGQLGIYPNCYCPNGTSLSDNGRCVPNQVQCRAPFIGYQPNCKCPKGTVPGDGTCVPVQQPCLPPMIGTPGNCHLPQPCPRNTHGQFPNCQPDYVPCPQGTHGRYPVCLPDTVQQCPIGTHGRFPKCSPDFVPPKPPVSYDCQQGTHWNGKRCVPDLQQQIPNILKQLPGLILKQKRPSGGDTYCPNGDCPAQQKRQPNILKLPGLQLLPGGGGSQIN